MICDEELWWKGIGYYKKIIGVYKLVVEGLSEGRVNLDLKDEEFGMWKLKKNVLGRGRSIFKVLRWNIF